MNIRSDGLFKGFMLQARVSENGPPLGEFRVAPGDSKSRTQMCSNSDVSVSLCVHECACVHACRSVNVCMVCVCVIRYIMSYTGYC